MANKKLTIKPKLCGEDGYKVFSVRIKNNLFSKIENACAKTGYNRNEITTMFIEYALENLEYK